MRKQDVAADSTIIDWHPLGRLAEPDENAAPILFLAGNEASFITGASLVVDGGHTIQWSSTSMTAKSLEDDF